MRSVIAARYIVLIGVAETHWSMYHIPSKMNSMMITYGLVPSTRGIRYTKKAKPLLTKTATVMKHSTLPRLTLSVATIPPSMQKHVTCTKSYVSTLDKQKENYDTLLDYSTLS